MRFRDKHKWLWRLCKVLIAIVLIIALLLGAFFYAVIKSDKPSPVGKQNPKKQISKTETITVDTDSAGNATSVTVNGLLRNNKGQAEIVDKNNLDDIVNMSGNEDYKKDSEGNIVWDAKGRNLKYSGVGDASSLPVKMHVKYKLDGKEIDAAELSGKSGKLEIEMSFENTSRTTLEGKEIPIPFGVMAAVVPNKSMKKVRITPGTIVDQGTIKVAMGIAIPGINEIGRAKALGDDWGEVITLTADVTDYSPCTVCTLVKSDVLDPVSNKTLKTIDMDSQIHKLDSATRQLVTGTVQLNEGIEEMKEKTPLLTDGLTTAYDGTKKLHSEAINGLKELLNGTTALEQLGLVVGQVTLAVGDMVSGDIDENQELGLYPTSKKANSQVASLNEQLDTLFLQIKTLKDQIAQLKALANSSNDPGLLTQIQQLENTEAQLQKTYDSMYAVMHGDVKEPGLTENSAAIMTGLGTINAIYKGETEEYKIPETYREMLDKYVDEMNDSSLELKDENGYYKGLDYLIGVWGEGASILVESVTEAQNLTGFTKDLKDGMKQLSDGGKTLNKGVDKLNKGSAKLEKGMSKYYNTGIKKLTTLYSKNVEGAAKMLKKLKKVGKDYGCYSGNAEGINGSSKFIYMTTLG